MAKDTLAEIFQRGAVDIERVCQSLGEKSQYAASFMPILGRAPGDARGLGPGGEGRPGR